jgi:hypothetical protein
MHRSEEAFLAVCADCGAEIEPETERGFRFGESQALCFACAERRGGAYDEARATWGTAPDVADLPPDA